MRKCLLFFATCTASAVVWGQSVPLASIEPASNVSREQRRTELRIILQAHRQWEPTATAADAMSVEHHLTEQERAEIRQQLRQHRPDRAKTGP